MAVTIELLELHGEGGFRIEDLTKRTGISKSSLYLRFGSRDGLLAAAYGRVFKQHVLNSITILESVVTQARDRESLRRAMHEGTDFVMNPDRGRFRLDRIAIIAGVRGRPEFREAIGSAQAELTSHMARILDSLAERGLVAPRHPSKVLAQFMQAYTIGVIIAELEEHENEQGRRHWVQLINEILDQLFFDGPVDD